MDKLAIANSMKISEWDGTGDELEYVLVADTQENREKLIQIGATEEDLKNATDSLDNRIDISWIVFQYTNVEWFSPVRGGFIAKRPEETEEKHGSHIG